MAIITCLTTKDVYVTEAGFRLKIKALLAIALGGVI